GQPSPHRARWPPIVWRRRRDSLEDHSHFNLVRVVPRQLVDDALKLRPARDGGKPRQPRIAQQRTRWWRPPEVVEPRRVKRLGHAGTDQVDRIGLPTAPAAQRARYP